MLKLLPRGQGFNPTDFITRRASLIIRMSENGKVVIGFDGVVFAEDSKRRGT